MNESFVARMGAVLGNIVTRPRESASWIWRGTRAIDPTFITQMNWYTGELPRVPLSEVLPAVRNADISIPNSFDRKYGTSMSIEEACHMAAIAKSLPARKTLEIGTFDGNSALVLATNSHPEGTVVTVDLPPDWDPSKDQKSLAYSSEPINLTSRAVLGRQIRDHPAASRVKQVFGDSGSLDWTKLGGPFDLIFIDGCHTEKYVESDTRNALKVLAPGGVIAWHDYSMLPDVSKVVDRFSKELRNMNFAALEGTRIAIAISNS